MLSGIQVKEGILDDSKYDLLFSVERVNELVLQGVPLEKLTKLSETKSTQENTTQIVIYNIHTKEVLVTSVQQKLQQ
jgi:hypothetical protein